MTFKLITLAPDFPFNSWITHLLFYSASPFLYLKQIWNLTCHKLSLVFYISLFLPVFFNSYKWELCSFSWFFLCCLSKYSQLACPAEFTFKNLQFKHSRNTYLELLWLQSRYIPKASWTQRWGFWEVAWSWVWILD